MEWFFIALLVAVGGIWSAYARSKGLRRKEDEAAGKPRPDR